MPMEESLKHTKWECKYHVVFIPKYRRKALYQGLRKHLGEVFRELCRQRECVVLEGHLMADHVHMLVSLPPKYSVSQVLGYIKGKSAIHIARTYEGKKAQFCWDALLGTWLLGLNGRGRRAGSEEVYPGAREAGSTSGSVRDVLNDRPLRAAPN